MKYKLNYTDGCICTSLTVNDIETIDMKLKNFRTVVSEMINYAWTHKGEHIKDIVSYLVKEVGKYKRIKYGKYDIFDEIEVYTYNFDEKNYLTYLSVPTYENLLVSELVCDYTKLVRQFPWNNNDHCTEKYLEIVQSMVSKIKDVAVLQGLFCDILETLGTPVHHDICKCCGDTIREYNLTI